MVSLFNTGKFVLATLAIIGGIFSLDDDTANKFMKANVQFWPNKIKPFHIA